ncbi:MAG: hypothetical protein V3V70_02005 [Candidatus Scalindua sp.]
MSIGGHYKRAGLFCKIKGRVKIQTRFALENKCDKIRAGKGRDIRFVLKNMNMWYNIKGEGLRELVSLRHLQDAKFSCGCG